MRLTFLERVTMLGVRRAWISAADGRVLIRRMRRYEQSWNAGAQLPDIPKRMKQRFFPVSVWAGFMVRMRDPSVFAAGVILIPPATVITLYWLAVRLTALATRWMGA